MILIADAHVNTAKGTHRHFFRMLDALEGTREDIVFMGDIFDLWIALPGYEQRVHARFLAWCRRQGMHRKIGYIEGNHEFFLAEEKGDAFSWATDRAFRIDGRGSLFCHGDRINPLDRNYLLFRKLTKNRFVKQMLRRLPWGPFIAEIVKKQLKHTNPTFRNHLPRKALLDLLSAARTSGIDRVFAAHFHQEAFFEQNGAHLHLLPAWMDTGRITRFDPRTGRVVHLPWQALSEGRMPRHRRVPDRAVAAVKIG
ncbi:UDP-2,3-diacylglucosamine diphosphatase [Desulfococcus sp.]|uniref:UDP-2,3-diacylglucosamine diphosphatase n=1 Tax=Desulfococcus sp. TaxID=2025834 RepID=UPI003D0A375A